MALILYMLLLRYILIIDTNIKYHYLVVLVASHFLNSLIHTYIRPVWILNLECGEIQNSEILNLPVLPWCFNMYRVQ